MRQTELKFTLDNQADQISQLDALFLERKLDLARRNSYLSLPLVALSVPNCEKVCTVIIVEELFTLTLHCDFSDEQISYINSKQNDNSHNLVNLMRKEQKSRIDDQNFKMFSDLNTIIRTVCRFNGKIELNTTNENCKLQITLSME